MEQKLLELKARLLEIFDLDHTGAVLNWDQSTYMPPGGATARARQVALLSRLAHQRLTDPALGRLLDNLSSYENSLPYNSDDASLIRVARRDFEQANRIPANFMAEFVSQITLAYQTWTEARPTNDFARVRPLLEKNLELSRRMAEYFPGYEHVADPLIGFADYGMKASSVRKLFTELREQLVPLVRKVDLQPKAEQSCLYQPYPKELQLEFGKRVIAQLGYDFQRGRQDLTPHPFMTKFSLGDVRITTRVKEDYLGDCVFSLIHEAGHAMYEQGIRFELEGTPLANGTSAGVHESQSRLWENIVGRSRGFWEYFFPELQKTFPTQLNKVSLNEFYQAINRVEKSLIRTEADEVTYNLHVMLRFDLELQLLEGSLSVRDLPEAWHERFEADFGITPPDDRDGVLQDVHWYGGAIGGAFQGYTIGNILSAQFYEQALIAHPDIPAEIRAGKFSTLHNWLKENIYQHGRKYTAAELVEQVTGGPLNIEPYMRYLKEKYQA